MRLNVVEKKKKKKGKWKYRYYIYLENNMSMEMIPLPYRMNSLEIQLVDSIQLQPPRCHETQ